jgi:hypothetical protein
MPHRKKPGTPVSVRSQREKRRKLRAKLTPVDVRGPGPHPRKKLGPNPLRSVGSNLRSAATIAARRARSTKPTAKLTPVEARKKRKGNSARRK